MSYVGIDLSGTLLRVVETEGSGRKPRITRFHQADVAAGESVGSAFLDKKVSATVERFFKDAKIAREPTCLSWDSSLTIFREIDLPFTSHDQLRKVIKFECESHILNCDIDDVVVSYFKLTETADKSHLMVMAVRKDHIQNRLDVLQGAGIDPMMIDLDVLAAFNTLSALGYTEEHKNFALLDCGRRTSNLLVVLGGRLVLARAIRLGCDAMTARLATDLGDGDGEEAARKLLAQPDPNADDLLVPAKSAPESETGKKPAELERDLALARVEDFQAKLGREVRRTLAVTRLEVPLELIYVTGAGSRLPGFIEKAADVFGVEAPIQSLDLLSRVEHQLDPEQAAEAETELVVPLGLALKLAGHDATQVDFRQEDVRYARKFDQVKEPLIYFCSFLLFFVLILNLADLKALSVKRAFLVGEQSADLARIHKVAVKRFQEAMGTDAYNSAFASPTYAAIARMQARMTQQIDMLKGELGRGGSIPRFPSAFDMMRDAFDKIQPRMNSIGKLMLLQMKVGVRNERNPFISLSGYVPSQAALEDLLEALRQLPDVKVERPRTTVTPENLVDFKDLRVTYPERKDI